MDDITKKLFEKFKKAYNSGDVDSLRRYAEKIAVRFEYVGRVGEYNEMFFELLDNLVDAEEFDLALSIGKRFLNPDLYEDAKRLTEIYLLTGDLMSGIEIIYPHLDIVKEDPEFKEILGLFEVIQEGSGVDELSFQNFTDNAELNEIESDPLIAHIVLIFEKLGVKIDVADKSLPYVYRLLRRATNDFRGNKDSWAAAFVYFYNDIMGDNHISARKISSVTGVSPGEIYRKSRILYERFVEEELI